MIIRSAELETVCGITSSLPANHLPEVAFAGRSNVGKSSLINCVLDRKSLARTSGQPGKTQTINFYNLNDEIYLVDLPGYGYAKTSKEERAKWGDMIERYLANSLMLRVIFLLVDIRHDATKQDKQMYEWICYMGYQPIVIATKADKVTRGRINEKLLNIQRTIGADDDTIIIPFSATTKEGREDVLDFFAQVIENEVS